jgi:cell wall-associated NlpC family hydrolase
MASGVGVTLAVTGSWLVYCGIKNVAPIQTLIAVVKDPANARAIISEDLHPLDQNASSFFPSSSSGTPTNPDPAAGNKIVAFARSQIGKPYIFGGTGNPGWDCSGLTQAALKSVGVDVPHSAVQQLLSAKGATIHTGSLRNPLDTTNLLPGDLIFPDYVGDHVGIYAGGGKIIHAPRPGTVVSEIPVWAIARVKRFTGTV